MEAYGVTYKELEETPEDVLRARSDLKRFINENTPKT
jgi:hypothetical protein